jgi:cell division protein FtsW
MNKKPSTLITIIFFLLVFFGLVILASATSVVGFAHFNDTYHYLKHQLLFGFLPGIILFFICAKINYKFWQKKAVWIFFGALLLLGLVFIPQLSMEHSAARSWLKIGTFSFQPAEFAKLALIIFLAAWLASAKRHLRSFGRGLLPFIFILGMAAGLIILQPDFGTALIIIFIAVGMYLIAGASWWHLFAMAVVGGGGIALFIFKAKYRMDRLLVFLKSDTDPLGVGYHLQQALIAIGSGGIFGLGLGKSRQKFEYLPEIAGDSIFAIMAEELGFIICALFILLIFYFICRILKQTKQMPDDFGRNFSLGFALWLGLQTFFNLGGMLNVLPMTGVPLPFISYGGTALMTLMAGSGILVNIIKNTEHKN